MEIKKCLLTNNDCYKKATKMTPKGIVVHSSGANNSSLKRYVQPDDGILGVNKYNNSWNKSGTNTCVHYFIGRDKNGKVRCYQTLPLDYACWGVGKGKKGSYNYNPTGHIQFEICEDNLKDETYFNQAFSTAIELCAYLCKEYNLPVSSIVSHHESHQLGYGSNHGDCDHWLKKFKKDMNWFRSQVQAKLDGSKPTPTPTEIWTTGNYKLLVAKCIRKQPNLGNNILKVKNCASATKKVLTSTKANDNAKIKVGTIVSISKIIKEGSRIWGQYGNCYIVLCNEDGTKQAMKV